MRYSHFEREPSFEYRYRKMREFSSKPFKLDLKATNTANSMGGSMNCDGISGGYESASNIAQVGNLSKKTRDFIGENLIDIENTLKALNLDFLQTFNELEKNDSAETLFGENYAYESNINPKILSTALKLTKFPQSYGSVDASPKSAKSSQFSPLEKQMNQQTFNGMQYLNDSSSADKLLDGKRSSTPDTGFASRETNSSRRGSQKSSYSPQESHYSPSYLSQADEARAAYAQLKANGSFPSRQRSMSFTENYELKSPIQSEPQSAKMHSTSGLTAGIRNNNSDGAAMIRARPRNSIAYKPKSIKARNLRRLSYNPIILDSSTSSSSETEFDHRNIAQSECDIRSKMFTVNRNRPHTYQYLNRKSTNFHSNSAFAPSQEKLYGSNASIKSAPQYNNYASDRQLHNYLDQKFNFHQCENFDEQPTTNNTSNFDRSQRGSSRRRQNARNNYILPPPPPPPVVSRVYDLNAPPTMNFSLYTQFDVNKLTGKSPTTQSFLQELFPESKNTITGTQPSQNTSSITINAVGTNHQTQQIKSIKQSNTNNVAFHWPEKIHASAVQQNNSLWPPSVQKSAQSLQTGAQQSKNKLGKTSSLPRFSSDSSSSTETDFNPRLPPSPAP